MVGLGHAHCPLPHRSLPLGLDCSGQAPGEDGGGMLSLEEPSVM